MFYKIVDLKNFAKFTEKTPVRETLFNKVIGLYLATLPKKDSDTGVF